MTYPNIQSTSHNKTSIIHLLHKGILKMNWTIEKRKQGNEIWVSSNVQLESILVGEGYEKKEYKRSMELAKVIVEALNNYEDKKRK